MIALAHPPRTRIACLAWLLCVAAALGACAKVAPAPVVPKPSLSIPQPAARTPLLPSHLTVSLVSKLTDFAPLLKDALADKLAIDQKDWTRAAGPKGVELETRIHAAVSEEPTLTMREQTLTVSIPITYYGEVRARAKTPLGNVWITKGTAWGTKAEPGRVVLQVDVEASVRGGARISTKSALTNVAFTAPNMDSICTSGLVRICVSRNQAAEYVHAEIEKTIRGEAPRALSALDETIAREANLSRVIDPALAALRTPQRTALGTWLSLAPKAAALGHWSGNDDQLTLGGELWLEPVFTLEKPETNTESVIVRDPTEDASALRLDLLIPFEQLSRAYGEAARRIRTRSAKVVGVTVLGVAQDGSQLALGIVLERAKRRVEIYALATPIHRDGSLILRDLTPTPASESALQYMKTEPAELRQAFEREAVVALSPFLADHVSAVRARMAMLLLPFGTLELTPEAQKFEELVAFEAKALRVRSEVLVSARLTH